MRVEVQEVRVGEEGGEAGRVGRDEEGVWVGVCGEVVEGCAVGAVGKGRVLVWSS